MELGPATESYAAYLNGLPRARAEFEPDELALFEEDLGRARREMEVAWFRAHPEAR